MCEQREYQNRFTIQMGTLNNYIMLLIPIFIIYLSIKIL